VERQPWQWQQQRCETPNRTKADQPGSCHGQLEANVHIEMLASVLRRRGVTLLVAGISGAQCRSWRISKIHARAGWQTKIHLHATYSLSTVRRIGRHSAVLEVSCVTDIGQTSQGPRMYSRTDCSATQTLINTMSS
jgi:hypothetical protein